MKKSLEFWGKMFTIYLITDILYYFKIYIIMSKLKGKMNKKLLAWIALVGIIAYSTWVLNVLGSFWRAVFPNRQAAPSNISSFEYGYGYGSLGWGYGYGYGYGYAGQLFAADGVGYYYANATTWSSAYANPYVISWSQISSVSTIVGTPTAASSVTLEVPVEFQAAWGVKVIIPAWTVITTVTGWTFDATALGSASVGSNGLTISLWSDSYNWAISFGISGVKLMFSRPIMIQIPVSTTASTISVKVSHAWDSTYTTASLTNVSTATCLTGIASPSSATASVSAGIATIYTCAASQFVAYTPTGTSSSSSSSSGWGGGGSSSGGGGLSSSSSSSGGSSSDTWYVAPTDEDLEDFEEEIKDMETTKQEMVINGTTVEFALPTFKSEKTNTAVAKLTKLIAKEITAKKITWDDLTNLVDSYNKFLAAVKLYKDEGNKEAKNIAKMYAMEIAEILWSYKTITVSSTLNDPEFEYAVAWMAKNGLTKYTSIDEYRPFDQITRQEAAKFFVQYAVSALWKEVDESMADKCNFTDLTGADSTLTPYITQACELWAMKGSNSTFRPFDPLSKGEAITVLVRLALWEMLDETVEPWFANYFAEAKDMSLTKETDVTKLWKNVTRYEAWLMIYRAANK